VHPSAGPPSARTRTAYVKDRCRCTDCTAANRIVTRERIYGRWHPYVDAGPVREHIAALRAAGIGVERIAQLAGLSVSHIRELAQPGRGHSPGTQRVRPSTATRVLRIGIADGSRAPCSRVDATGTRRRLQALIAIGWPTELLAAQLGRRPNNLRRTMTGESVTARTAQDVATLYERLWNSRPPRLTNEQRAAADAARAQAAARGWLPPLAWDDIDTDLTPPPALAGGSQRNDMDEIAVERALAGDHITYEDLTMVNNRRSSAVSPHAVAQSGTSLPSSARRSAPSLDGGQPSVRRNRRLRTGTTPGYCRDGSSKALIQRE
jgi:hypothetical protein